MNKTSENKTNVNYFNLKQVFILYCLSLKNSFFYYLLIFLLSITTYNSFSQEVTINGDAKWAKGKTVRLLTITDRISLTEKELASALIDSSGTFKININTPYTIQTFIRVDNSSDEIFLEPGKNYHIRLVSDKSIIGNRNDHSYSKKGNLIIDFISPDISELNSLIRRFNYLCNDFIIHDIESILKSRSKQKLDSFKTAINNEFKEVNNEYFNTYKFYRIGSVEYFTRLKSNAIIEKEYFYNKPVLYVNSEYMEFFNDFYSKYISSSVFMNFSMLDKIVNENGNYNELYEFLKKDTLLQGKDLLDLVTIKQLDNLYHIKDFKKENVLKLLKEAKLKSASKENKMIASYLYKLLTKLAPYTKAPSFKLKDSDGNAVSLKDFKGKYVYITFFKTTINSCIAEIKLLNSISQKYSDRITFICISVDKDEDVIRRFIKENPDFKLTFLYYYNDRNLLSNYEIKAFPTFVLINPDGDIVSYPAPKPSDRIDKIFDRELKNSR